MEAPENFGGCAQAESKEVVGRKNYVDKILRVCQRQRRDKQRLRMKIEKLKSQLKRSKSKTSALREALDKSNRCKESLQMLCKNCMERLNESNTKLARLMDELDDQKRKCNRLLETVKTKIENISPVSEHDGSSKIVRELLKLFAIDKKENLLEDLSKVQRVMLTLPKLQNFVNEIYEILDLSGGNSKPAKVLSELREVAAKAKEHRQMQDELRYLLNIKIANTPFHEIKRKATEALHVLPIIK